MLLRLPPPLHPLVLVLVLVLALALALVLVLVWFLVLVLLAIPLLLLSKQKQKRTGSQTCYNDIFTKMSFQKPIAKLPVLTAGGASSDITSLSGQVVQLSSCLLFLVEMCDLISSSVDCCSYRKKKRAVFST